MDLSKRRLDPERSKNGVWRDYDGQTSLLIARWLNPEFRRRLREEIDRFGARGRRGRRGVPDLDPETDIAITAAVMADTILLGWRGMLSGGEEVRYDRELAERALREDDAFRADVIEMAQEEEFYRQEEDNETGES